jgi:hypothetical protein
MFVSKMFGNKGRVPYFQQAGFESQGIKPSAPRAQVAHDQAEWAATFWRAAGFRPARAAGVVDGLLSPEPAPEGLAPGLAFSNRDQGFRYSKTSEQSLLLTELTCLHEPRSVPELAEGASDMAAAVAGGEVWEVAEREVRFWDTACLRFFDTLQFVKPLL